MLTLGSLCAQSIFSSISYISQNDVEISNTDCLGTNSCSLLKAHFLVREYHFTVDGDDVFGSHLYAWYETSSLATLQDYVFVQLVRGCIYSSTWENGQEQIEFGFFQKIFDEYRLAVFHDWIIDSIDTDPTYNSMPGYPRHYFYRWNKPPYAISKNTEKFFGKRRPKIPVLYISDLPSQGMYLSFSNRAISTSFEYKMGVYPSKDVPLHTAAENVAFAQPLIEFSWKNSWIYDHLSSTFQKKHDISPLCALAHAS